MHLLNVSSMDEPWDLFSVVKAISCQLSQIGVAHDYCSLQVVNEAGDDFISLFQGNSYPGSPAWEKISNPSWSKDSTNTEDYPWVLEVLETKISRYQTCNSPNNPLPEGMSIIDVPYSQGTLAISAKTSNAFSEEDIEILERFAGVISSGFQRFRDIVARRQVEETP